MRRSRTVPTALLFCLALSASPAFGIDGRGAPAALFTKNELAPGPTVGDTLSLSDYPNQVVLLFLFEPN
jgi:hypothetical protein